MYTKLFINGAEITHSASLPVKPNRLTLGLDRPSVFEFSEGPGRSIIPSYALYLPVQVWIDVEAANVCVFRGRIQSLSSNHGSGFTHLYSCVGLDAEVDRIPITPEYTFNAERTTPEYSPTLSGKNVGQIVRRVLEDRATELTALGFDLSNLSTFDSLLAITPTNTDVRAFGERLWTWVKSFISQWCPRYSPTIEYTATGARFGLIDRVSPTGTLNLTIGEDWVLPPQLAVSVESSATRIVVRGSEKIEPRELSLIANTLDEDWTTSEELAWKLTDFTSSELAQDSGTVTASGGTTITVESNNGTKTWAANYWSGEREGQILLNNESIPGVNGFAFREIVSNTALAPGGQSVITIGEPIGTGWTKYKLFGKKLVREHVWRRYKPADASLVGKLRSKFPKPINYLFAAGSAAITGQEFPMGFLLHPDDAHRFQETCYVDQGASRLWLAQPIVTHAALGNTLANLNNGTVTTQPYDVLFLAPVSLGFLEAIYPPNSGANPVYSGLAKDLYGIEKTKYILVPDWTESANQEKMLALAIQTHQIYSAPNFSGSITLLGLRSHWAFPLGKRLVLAAKNAPGGAAISLGNYAAPMLAISSITVDWGVRARISTQIGFSSPNSETESLELYYHSLQGSEGQGFLEISGLPESGFEFFGGEE